MSGRGTRSILKRNGSVKQTKRIRFSNRQNVAQNLLTPAYVTGFNRTNPISRAFGWQTKAERDAAVTNARIQKLMEKGYGIYVEPYKYQDPHFAYPLTSRKNMALAASNLAAINSAIEAIEMSRNADMLTELHKGPTDHVTIDVKPESKRQRRQTRRRYHN